MQKIVQSTSRMQQLIEDILQFSSIKEKRLRLEILALGREFATVSLVFKVRGQEAIGRQTQTWVRFPDLGWKVVNAHVSMTTADIPEP